MAVSSTDEIPTQLAALLGKKMVRIRKTDEAPPRVSVIDVAIAVTGHDANYASQAVRNICGKYPDVHEKIMDVKFSDARGRKGQKNTPAVDVRGVVEIIMLLPGQQAARVRRQAAELLVRYLGGDLGIIDEVIALHGLQEELAVRAPDDPRHIFGEDVAAAPLHAKGHCKRLLDDVRAVVREEMQRTHAIEERLTQAVREEMQRTHHWNFQKRGSVHNTLVDLGIIVEGDELAALDNDEHVVRIVDFLKEQLPSDEWRWHGNKLKNIFAVALKRRKIEQRISEDRPFFITKNQKEYRIIYTEADHELMMDVFKYCKRRFNGIVTRDEAILKSHRKQRRIQDYFTRDVAASSSAVTLGTNSQEENLFPACVHECTSAASAKASNEAKV